MSGSEVHACTTASFDYHRHKRSEQILRRKAEDYQRILRGEGELPGEFV